jgi:mRNA interferase MazF
VTATLEHGRGTVTVVPLTSNTANVYPFHVLLPAGIAGLARDSKAQAEQLRAVSVRRLIERVGRVPERISREVDGAIRLYLGL